MKPLLFTPCTPKWILHDIIYIYTLEPSSFKSPQTGKLIQKTAGNLVDRMLLNNAIKRVAASNILFLVSAMVIGSGLCYAINWYKERNKRKKAAAFSQNPEKPAIPLSEVYIEKFPHVNRTGRNNQLQDAHQKGNTGSQLENQYTR